MLILVGTHVTMRRLPAHLQSRCRWIRYSGVEHEVFRPPSTVRANRVPRLLFVGRITPYKGVELLLRAAAVARRRCKFELTIVGGGSLVYRKYCENLITCLQLRDTVAILPNKPRTALVALYQAADVFCMPSVETYGIAILEAMSSGCAVLVSDFNGPGEIVHPGAGVKVPLRSPDQFIGEYAERIVELVEDSRLRDRLGEAAREHVVRHHDWQRVQMSLLEIYDDVVARQSAVRPTVSEPIATV